jgi:hypothetical protein
MTVRIGMGLEGEDGRSHPESCDSPIEVSQPSTRKVLSY